MEFDKLFEAFTGLFPWQQREQEIANLALRIESQVRALNGIEDVAPNAAHGDLVATLTSATALLDRLQQLEHDRAKFDREPASLPPEMPVEPAPPPAPFKIAQDPEPSHTAKELIKLRDNILLAIEENTTGDVRMFQSLDRKLGKILDREGVQTIDLREQFNYEQQQVMDTKPTEDPNLDGMVCTTLRPGYLFDGKLIRPQEVIIYKLSE